MPQRTMRMLVTGGAGFIGQKLVSGLAEHGHSVVVLDNLLPQVHGTAATFPHWEGDVSAVRGDVRDGSLVSSIMDEGVDVVYHLAAMTGVGQSMYQIAEYVDVNCRGTAILLDAIAASRKRPGKIVLSSSRAVYGEGRLQCADCGLEFYPLSRQEKRLACRQWEHACPRCGADGRPLPSLETSPCQPTSVYGLTKRVQEQLCQVAGIAYGVLVVVLRYFNVYGPGQSPINPYTGILSIFARRLISGQVVEIYEDGRELRDFVYVDDVIQANLSAAEPHIAGVYNVCSGQAQSLVAVAAILAELLGCVAGDAVAVTGKYRVGDVRHALGSSAKAGTALRHHQPVPLHVGLHRMVTWLLAQELAAVDDLDHRAEEELRSRDLLHCGLAPLPMCVAQ